MEREHREWVEEVGEKKESQQRALMKIGEKVHRSDTGEMVREGGGEEGEEEGRGRSTGR